MIEILHDLKDPKVWEVWYIIMGNAGFISSTVVQLHHNSSPNPVLILPAHLSADSAPDVRRYLEKPLPTQSPDSFRNP